MLSLDRFRHLCATGTCVFTRICSLFSLSLSLFLFQSSFLLHFRARLFLLHGLLDLFNLLFLAAGRNLLSTKEKNVTRAERKRERERERERETGRERTVARLGLRDGLAQRVENRWRNGGGNFAWVEHTWRSRRRCLKLRGSFETLQFHSSRRGRARRFRTGSRLDFSLASLEVAGARLSLSLSLSLFLSFFFFDPP